MSCSYSPRTVTLVCSVSSLRSRYIIAWQKKYPPFLPLKSIHSRCAKRKCKSFPSLIAESLSNASSQGWQLVLFLQCELYVLERIPWDSSANDPAIAFRQTLFLGRGVRLHEQVLCIKHQTWTHCRKLLLSESTLDQSDVLATFFKFLFFIGKIRSTKNPERFPFLTRLSYMSGWKNELRGR